MARRIHAFVQHTANFQDAVVGPAEDDEVSRSHHALSGIVYPSAAECQVVGHRARELLRSIYAAGAMRVIADVSDRLRDQNFIVPPSALAKMLLGPSKDVFDIACRPRRNADRGSTHYECLLP